MSDTTKIRIVRLARGTEWGVEIEKPTGGRITIQPEGEMRPGEALQLVDVIARALKVDQASRGIKVPIDADTHDMGDIPLRARLRAWPTKLAGEDTLSASTVAALMSAAADEIEALTARITELEALINHPLNADWFEGVRIEAAHQVERWGSAHDAGKLPLDWFWLIGFFAQKATRAALDGDVEKAKHHTISTAAALLNWHRQISGSAGPTSLRPGILTPPGETAS